MTGAAGDEGHNAPCSNKDFDFFYRGLEAEQVLVQKCGRCGALRNPPSPACPECRSLEWDTVALSGEGTVHSFTVHHHPPLPGFATPHPVVLADMAEGVRLVGAMDGTPADAIRIGMQLRFEYLRRGDVAAFRFRPA